MQIPSTPLVLAAAISDGSLVAGALAGGLAGFAIAAVIASWRIARLQREHARALEGVAVAVHALRAKLDEVALGGDAARAQPAHACSPAERLIHLIEATAGQVGAALGHMDEQHAVLAATLESMLEGLLLIDGDGRVLRANSSAVALLEGRDLSASTQRSDRSLAGWPLIGRPLREVVDERDHPLVDSLLDAVSRGSVREKAIRVRVPRGTLTLTLNASAYRGSGGQVQGAVLVLRDDSDLREAQAQMQMTGRLAAMGTVAAGVAHEINNPLAFVLSNLDFALEELADADTLRREEALAEVVEALDAARRGGERVRAIVRELKTLSRSDRDSSGRVDVNALITTAVTMLDNEIRHHARLHLDLGDVPPVHGSEAKLGQVFLNLIQNASQAIVPGHAAENTIRVTSDVTPEGYVRVAVADTGRGIAPEDRERIFDAFFTTKPVGVGTGLGLAISHRVVTGLGGRIEVESEPGGGALFVVLLPLAEPSGA